MRVHNLDNGALLSFPVGFILLGGLCQRLFDKMEKQHGLAELMLLDTTSYVKFVRKIWSFHATVCHLIIPIPATDLHPL